MLSVSLHRLTFDINYFHLCLLYITRLMLVYHSDTTALHINNTSHLHVLQLGADFLLLLLRLPCWIISGFQHAACI